MPQKIGHLDLIQRVDTAPFLFQKSFASVFCAQDILVARVFKQLQRESDRLKKHICQNMSDDLAKHIEAHRIHLKKRIAREASVFSRSIP